MFKVTINKMLNGSKGYIGCVLSLILNKYGIIDYLLTKRDTILDHTVGTAWYSLKVIFGEVVPSKYSNQCDTKPTLSQLSTQ